MNQLRASDREREGVVDRLRGAAAEGRLDAAELEQRVEAAYGARTTAELEPLVADLPPEAARKRAPRTPFRPEARVFFAVSLLLIAIWALTGLGYFWPVWPILGWGIPLFLFGKSCGGRRLHQA